MKSITSSVGNSPNCQNKPNDVKTVKTLLAIAAINQAQKKYDPGRLNGSLDDTTIKAIKAFHLSKFGKSSGAIEPNSQTMQQLNAIAKAAVKTIKAHQAPVVMAKSKRNPGKNPDGTIANDMKCGDYTKEQIENLRWNFVVDDVLLDLDSVKPKLLFDSFRNMATALFSTGELEKNILRMIDKFESSSGGTYSHPILERTADKHERTQAFVNEFNGKLKTVIVKYRGDITKVRPAFDITMTNRIYFNTTRDILSGMTIATNDIWAWSVDIPEYDFDGINYKGKYTITLYDHFGLDEPDVNYSKSYGNLSGFRAWFILQHLKRFAYKPYITVIKLTKPFAGSLH